MRTAGALPPRTPGAPPPTPERPNGQEEKAPGTGEEFFSAVQASAVTAAVCVLGKKNNPLFLRCTDKYKDQETYFQSLVFCSLDIVDECIQRKTQDSYLGFLCPIDDYQIFGYITSTKIKFIVVLYDENLVQEPDLRDFFQKTHAAYVDYVMNPFHRLGDVITSNRFASSVDVAAITHLEKPAPSTKRPATPATVKPPTPPTPPRPTPPPAPPRPAPPPLPPTTTVPPASASSS
mmetsp:Transcript_8888/g.27352  ORF Transcript_8888/g.27352 Transcript_8888/m.27352 type:complete len:234 (+) Transcript_8888:40-741(+)